MTVIDHTMSRPGRHLWLALVGSLIGIAPSAVTGQQRTTGSATPVSSPALVFEGVTVVDVEHGTLVPSRRVVIVGNRIRTISEAGAGALPAGARIINAHNQYLIPGLWDMQTHMQTGGNSRQPPAEVIAQLLVTQGVTGIRNVGLEAGRFYQDDGNQRPWREVLDGTSIGPPRQLFTRYLQADSELARPGKSKLGSGVDNVVLDMDQLNFAVADIARQSGRLFAAPVEDVGKRYGIPSLGISVIEASDSGVNLIEHLSTSGGLDTLCWGSTSSVARCQPVARRMGQNRTWWVPTLIAAFSQRTPAINAASRGRRVFDRYRTSARAFLAGMPLSSVWLRDSTSQSGRRPAAGALAVAQRVALPLLAGTDGKWPSLPGLALHAELALYQAEGLTPLRALQAATLEPAKLLRATDSLGTVAPGKLADLVLIDANPLEDITNTTTIRAVVANGRYYDRTALDQLLASVQALVKEQHLSGMLP